MTNRTRVRLAAWWIFAACAGARGVRAQVVRHGSEFRVSTYTVGGQTYPKVALDGDGDFVVTWSSQNQDGNSYGVFGQRYSSSGTPRGLEFQINTHTTNLQTHPTIAAESDGDFIVAWSSFDQEGAGGQYGVFARRFDSNGSSLGSEFQVNTHTLAYQSLPSIGIAANGIFIVAWQSYQQDGQNFGVFARRFDSAGLAFGGELQVNTFTLGQQRRPAVAVGSGGDFVVVWDASISHDGDLYGVFARRFDFAGTPFGPEFQINTYTTGNQLNATVATRDDGDFVVAWQSAAQDGQDDGIFARRFSSAGAGLAAEFQVNTYTPTYQRRPAAAADGDGNLVVTWLASDHDGSGVGVFARRYDSSGAAVAGEFQVNTYTGATQSVPAIAFDDDLDFVIAWHSVQDAASFGIYAQRFSIPVLATLDVDGNGTTDPLSDGLLVLRYESGFTGPALTAGAVRVGCTRCDSATIGPYLAGLGTILDIDGSGGAIDPLTDGILVLRYLFGFSGTVLTSDAVATQTCTRCEHGPIIGYLQTLDG